MKFIRVLVYEGDPEALADHRMRLMEIGVRPGKKCQWQSDWWVWEAGWMIDNVPEELRLMTPVVATEGDEE